MENLGSVTHGGRTSPPRPGAERPFVTHPHDGTTVIRTRGHLDSASGGRLLRLLDAEIEMARAVLAQDAWIFEGGFFTIQSERLARAQVVIWLDLPVGLRMWRVFRRTVCWYGRVRPDLQEGCPEGRHPGMLEFWRFIWRTRHSGRQRVAASLEPVPEHQPAHCFLKWTYLASLQTFRSAENQNLCLVFSPLLGFVPLSFCNE